MSDRRPCGRCGKLIRWDKPILGSWHVCATDEEAAFVRSMCRQQAAVRSGRNMLESILGGETRPRLMRPAHPPARSTACVQMDTVYQTDTERAVRYRASSATVGGIGARSARSTQDGTR